MNWLQVLGWQARGMPPQSGSAYEMRKAMYTANDLYYRNLIFSRTADGGERDLINQALGNAAAADLRGLYNPLSAVVDLYLNVFHGRFGEEIPIIREERAPPALDAALITLWTWSNMDMLKQRLCRYAALHGCAGLRIVAQNDINQARRRVYLRVEHPEIIRDVEVDERGNIVGIELEYDRTTGLGDAAETIRIREVQTKETIAFYHLEHGQATLIRQDDNTLGVVSYVIVPFEQDESPFGRNAWHRVQEPLHSINSLLSHIDVQVHRHVRAKWLVASSGAAPTEFDLSDMSIVHVDSRSGTVTAQPLIAELNLADATNQAKLQIELIENMLPELLATQGKFLAGQSGETIAQLRQPAEDRILLARSTMEDAVVRAQQIALSWMILFSLADLGTGTGTREAADRAYHDGHESHRFGARPAFPTRQPLLAQESSNVPATGLLPLSRASQSQ